MSPHSVCDETGPPDVDETGPPDTRTGPPEDVPPCSSPLNQHPSGTDVVPELDLDYDHFGMCAGVMLDRFPMSSFHSFIQQLRSKRSPGTTDIEFAVTLSIL